MTAPRPRRPPRTFPTGPAPCGCTFHRHNHQVNKLCPAALRLYSQPGLIVHGGPPCGPIART
jgi:hypothetical protein